MASHKNGSHVRYNTECKWNDEEKACRRQTGYRIAIRHSITRVRGCKNEILISKFRIRISKSLMHLRTRNSDTGDSTHPLYITSRLVRRQNSAAIWMQVQVWSRCAQCTLYLVGETILISATRRLTSLVSISIDIHVYVRRVIKELSTLRDQLVCLYISNGLSTTHYIFQSFQQLGYPDNLAHSIHVCAWIQVECFSPLTERQTWCRQA